MHFAIEFGPVRIEISNNPSSDFPLERAARAAAWIVEWAVSNPYQAKSIVSRHVQIFEPLVQAFVSSMMVDRGDKTWHNNKHGSPLG